MSKTIPLLSKVFKLLNSQTCYAVLRNFEGLPIKNNSRDIDIAIEPNDFYKIQTQLVHIISECNWNILMYLKNDRMITLVCGIIDDNELIDTIQFDFFLRPSVYGITLLDNKKILAQREYNGKVYHASIEYVFLDKYVYCRAIGMQYPQKYEAIRKEAEFNLITEEIIQEIFGVRCLSECDKLSRYSAVSALLKWNFKHYGLITLINLLRFIYYYIKNYICSSIGFTIGFTGPDGSGKTTVINLLRNTSGKIFQKGHFIYHFRPGFLKNLGEVAYSAGIKRNVDRNFNNPHRGKKTGKLNSLIRLIYYSFDYILGFLFVVKWKIRNPYFVIFDRYFTDIICDSRRSRINLSTKFLYTFGKIFIPSLDYNILLTAKTDTILARKQELDAQSIAEINRKIDYLKHKPNYYKIINDTTPQAAVAKILRIIFAKQHERNLRRLN